MPKNIVQDVIPPANNRRSIRDIPLGHVSENFRQVSEENAEIVRPADSSPQPAREIRYRHKEEEEVDWSGGVQKNRGRWLIWFIGLIALLGLLYVLGNIFSGATVSITPKSEKVSVNIDLVAKPGSPAGELGYTSVVLTKDADEVVAADGDRPVESRASGKIIIYNNYGTAPQRLVKNTRFETPDGLIYKIAESLVIPGRYVVSGKTVPGSIEARVFAEATGSEYNIGLTDFTIPGFKSNAARFAAFYGRSKTPMTGGKTGTEKYVTDEKMLQARARIEGKLLKDLIAEAKTKVPDDSVFYDKAYTVTYEQVLAANPDGGNNVTVRERANFTAYFMPKDALAAEIAKNALDNYDNSPVTASGEDSLSFELKNDTSLSAATVGPIQFNIKGDATIIYTFDQNKLKGELAGKSKNALSSVAGNYGAILNADVVVRPFWAGSFPSSADKIKIVVLNPDR